VCCGRFNPQPGVTLARHCNRLCASATCFAAQCPAAPTQGQTVAVGQGHEKNRIDFPIVSFVGVTGLIVRLRERALCATRSRSLR